MIYEDLVDPDLTSTETIEEKSLMMDVEDVESADAYDHYILASVMLPKDGIFARA